MRPDPRVARFALQAWATRNYFGVGDESRRSFFPEWGSTAGGPLTAA